MQRQYETVFIMNPVLSDEQMKEAVSKFREFLKKNGAEIIFENNLGLSKLTYPIQKKFTGFFYLFEFMADTQLVTNLELEFRRDEKVIRYLTTSLDKHAIAYNKKRRSEKEQKPEKEKTQEDKVVD